MSSVAHANKILDEAERKLLKNLSKAELIDLVNKAWSIGTNGSQYQFSELAKNGRLNATGAKYTNVAVGILGAGGNWIIADANNEKLDEKLVGVGVDAALIAVGFIPGVGQVLNVALIGASLAGLDISGWIKSKYRGDKIDSLYWVSIKKWLFTSNYARWHSVCKTFFDKYSRQSFWRHQRRCPLWRKQ